MNYLILLKSQRGEKPHFIFFYFFNFILFYFILFNLFFFLLSPETPPALSPRYSCASYSLYRIYKNQKQETRGGKKNKKKKSIAFPHELIGGRPKSKAIDKSGENHDPRNHVILGGHLASRLRYHHLRTHSTVQRGEGLASCFEWRGA